MIYKLLQNFIHLLFFLYRANKNLLEYIPSNLFMFQKERKCLIKSNRKIYKFITEISNFYLEKWVICLEYSHNTFVFTFIFANTKWKTFNVTFTTFKRLHSLEHAHVLHISLIVIDGSFNCQFGINLSSLLTHPS